MGLERTDWSREASLLRPAKLSLALFDGAPALDMTRPWVPEHLLPLFGGRGLDELTASHRLRYNHAYARQLLHEFVWTEREMIVAPLKRLCQARRLDSDTALVLESFISDELHHIACFSHLEDLAVAADQPASKSMLKFPRTIRAMVRMAARYPVQLSFWAAAIEAFEQYSIKIGQCFHRDASVDSLFRDVFVTHARDEARHCRLDTLLRRWLHAEAGAIWNVANRPILSSFYAAYRSVHWGLDGPLRDLARSHPETADRFAALHEEAKALRRATPLPAGPL